MKRKASQVEIVDSVESELYSTVRAIITRARAAVYVAANTAMVEAYWNVGREIVAKQGGKAKAKYGEGLVKGLAVKLTAEFGDGFTEANLRYMRLVYLAFPNRHTLCDKLSWSHYRTLVKVENPDAQLYKHYYEREMMNPGDNPPVGIVLGSDTDSAVVKYTLNEHERNLFAVKYHLELPTVDELQLELRRERQAIEEAIALLPPPKGEK